jgi:hypothetical protein
VNVIDHAYFSHAARGPRQRSDPAGPGSLPDPDKFPTGIYQQLINNPASTYPVRLSTGHTRQM